MTSASKFISVELEKIVEFHDGDRSSNYPKRDEFVPTGVPFLNAECISSGKLMPAGLNYISREKFRSLSKGKIAPLDVVLTMRGNGVGKPAIIPEHFSEGLINAQMLILRPIDKRKLNPKFLYYYLISPLGKEALSARVSGSAQPQLTIRDLRRLAVRLPSPESQFEISSLLSSLDDKIELNLQMNQTLEQIARAIFKSWFIDFDPVKAKAEGKKPFGMDDATAALFPDSFEDSELGPIPKGWSLKGLSHAVDCVRESASVESITQSTNYIALEHMPRGLITLDTWGHAGEVASQKSRFSKGDILFGKLRPYFKKVGFAQIDGVCSTDILVLRPKRMEYLTFALMHASSDPCIDFTTARSEGTRMPRTSWKDLGAFQITMPSDETLCAFQKMTSHFLTLISNNSDETKSLSALRDLLLPRLISGDLAISEIN